MKKNLQFISCMALAMTLLVACGDKSSTSSTPSVSSVPPSSIESSVSADVTSSSEPTSSSSEPVSSEEPVITPAVVETQTKQIDGFTSTTFNNGEVYVNETVLTLGGTIADLNAHVEQTKSMRLYSEESKAEFDAKMKEDKRGAGGEAYIYFYSDDGTTSRTGMNFLWRVGDVSYKYSDALFNGVDIIKERGCENSPLIDVVLPNGWYLGGTVSEEDRLSLTSEPPTTSVVNGYLWYDYPLSEEGIAANLKFDIQTGKFSEIRLFHNALKYD